MSSWGTIGQEKGLQKNVEMFEKNTEQLKRSGVDSTGIINRENGIAVI